MAEDHYHQEGAVHEDPIGPDSYFEELAPPGLDPYYHDQDQYQQDDQGYEEGHFLGHWLTPQGVKQALAQEDRRDLPYACANQCEGITFFPWHGNLFSRHVARRSHVLVKFMSACLFVAANLLRFALFHVSLTMVWYGYFLLSLADEQTLHNHPKFF